MKTWKKIKWVFSPHGNEETYTIAKYRRDCSQDQIDEIIESLFEVSERKYVDQYIYDFLNEIKNKLIQEKNELITQGQSLANKYESLRLESFNERGQFNYRIQKLERENSQLLTENEQLKRLEEQLTAQIKSLQQKSIDDFEAYRGSNR